MNLTDIILISGAVICFASAFIIASRPLKKPASKINERKLWDTHLPEENKSLKI